jgi:peptidyl-prolyl cis-trans isomerase NIMA-interacting 1
MNIFNKLVFVPDKPFQSSLIFVSETGAYPSVAPAPGLTHKRQNRLERPTRDKRSTTNSCNKFCNIVYQASKYSDCSSAKRGGDLGPFGRGEMQVKFLKIYISGYDRQSAEDNTQFC